VRAKSKMPEHYVTFIANTFGFNWSIFQRLFQVRLLGTVVRGVTKGLATFPKR